MNSVTQFSINNNDYDLKDSKAINRINYNGSSYMAENGVVNINDTEKSTRVHIVDLKALPQKPESNIDNSIVYREDAEIYFNNGFTENSAITTILNYLDIPIAPNVIYFLKLDNKYNAVITSDNSNYTWLMYDIPFNSFKNKWAKEEEDISFSSFEAFQEVLLPYNHKAIYFTSFNWFKTEFDNTTSKINKSNISVVISNISVGSSTISINSFDNTFTKYIIYDSESHLLREPYIVLLQNNYLIKIPLVKKLGEGKFIASSDNIVAVPYAISGTAPTEEQENFARSMYYPIEG